MLKSSLNSVLKKKLQKTVYIIIASNFGKFFQKNLLKTFIWNVQEVDDHLAAVT